MIRKSIAKRKPRAPKTLSTPGNNRVGRSLVTVHVPRSNLNFFPDIYRAWAQTDFDVAMTAAVGISLQYKASDPLNLMGPRVDYAGAFAANVPSGIQYLVSSNNVAGAAAPYRYCLAERTEAEVELYGIQTNAVPTQLTIMFGVLLDQTSGMTRTHIAEQPFSKTLLLPCNQTVPMKLKISINHWDAFGITEKVYKDSIFQYACGVGVPTGLPLFFTICTRSIDGTTVRTDYIRTKLTTLFSFHQRNAFATNTPTISSGESASSSGINEPWMVVHEKSTNGGPGVGAGDLRSQPSLGASPCPCLNTLVPHKSCK